MTEPEMLALVAKCLNLYGSKQYDAGGAFIAPDCEYENVPMGKVTGPAGVRKVIEPFFAPTLENEFIFRTSLVQGDLLAIERLDRHRLATGWVELPVMGLFRIQHGLIYLWRDYFDLPTIMKHWPRG